MPSGKVVIVHKLHLSNYATKFDLKRETGIKTSNLAAKKILLLWKLNLTNYILILVNVLKGFIEDCINCTNVIVLGEVSIVPTS